MLTDLQPATDFYFKQQSEIYSNIINEALIFHNTPLLKCAQAVSGQSATIISPI